MKIRKQMWAIAALLIGVMAGCSHEDADQLIIPGEPEAGYTATVTASAGNDARTRLTYEDGGTHTYIGWSAGTGEQFSLCYDGGAAAASYLFKKNETEATRTATFTATGLPGIPENKTLYAVYPGSQELKAGVNNITVDFSEQDGNATGKHLMVATLESNTLNEWSDADFTFRSQVALVKLTVTNTAFANKAITSITFSGSGLNNKAVYTFRGNTGWLPEGSGNTILVNGSDISGNSLGQATVYIAVPPTIATTGTIQITTVCDGINYTGELSDVRLEANKVYEAAVGVFPEVYMDGGMVTCQTASAGATKPVRVVFIGDGFIAEDYMEGGAFNKAANKAIKAFFAVEPYKTYRDYFTVYKLAAYSEERGATVLNKIDYYNIPAQSKNTKFSSVLEGGGSTGISCGHDAVWSYVENALGVSEAEMAGIPIMLLINLEVYAGTALMSTRGDAIAMCPIGDTLEEIVQHEGGGHAFAKLLDEYIYNDNASLPDSDIAGLMNRRALSGGIWKWGANIDLTGSDASVHWKHYLGMPKYNSMVNLFEGALEYGKGVWRAESNSCMNNNVPYFNAPSREAIVRRIMEVSGGIFDYTAFYANDKIVPPPTVRTSIVRPPLGKPIIVKN